MRILWFTTSPSSASKNEGTVNLTGGWVISEEKALKRYCPEIQLGICFISKKNTKPYFIDNTQYYPVKEPKISKLQKHLSKSGVRLDNLYDHKALFHEIIENFKPDIIQIFGTENHFGLILDNLKIPVVLSVQGIVTVCLHKYFSGIPAKEVSNNFLSFSNRFIKQYHYYHYLSEFEQDTLKKIKYIFGRTYWDKQVTSVLAPESEYFHIDRFLRESYYLKSWSKTRDNELVLITTLRSSLYKGFETIIAAAGILKNLGINFTWKIAGLESHDVLMKILNKKYECVSDRIVLLGRLSEEALVKHLLESDIYIQASHIENSPNGVAEALILGMPVIATYAGGTAAYISNRQDGILIQDGDPWSMAGAILELYNSEKLSLQFGQEARKRAMVRHNPKRIASDILSAYRIILKQQ